MAVAGCRRQSLQHALVATGAAAARRQRPLGRSPGQRRLVPNPCGALRPGACRCDGPLAGSAAPGKGDAGRRPLLERCLEVPGHPEELRAAGLRPPRRKGHLWAGGEFSFCSKASAPSSMLLDTFVSAALMVRRRLVDLALAEVSRCGAQRGRPWCGARRGQPWLRRAERHRAQPNSFQEAAAALRLARPVHTLRLGRGPLCARHDTARHRLATLLLAGMASCTSVRRPGGCAGSLGSADGSGRCPQHRRRKHTRQHIRPCRHSSTTTGATLFRHSIAHTLLQFRCQSACCTLPCLATGMPAAEHTSS